MQHEPPVDRDVKSSLSLNRCNAHIAASPCDVGVNLNILI